MGVFKSPGVFVKEENISIVYPKFPNNYLRKSKISKIFAIENKSIIITSTQKGPNSFPKEINNFDDFEKIFKNT